MSADPFEIVGVLTGVLAVWLTTREKIWCWPIGIVSVSSFIVVFFRAKLYAAMGLQAVFIALAVYGWYAWLRGGEGQAALQVSCLTRRLAVGLLVLGSVTSVAAAGWLRAQTDEVLPWLDGSTTAFSLVAQWMQARKFLENWLVWMVVDVAYVGMSLSQGLTLTAGLYAIYAGLAVLGFRDWRRSLLKGSRA